MTMINSTRRILCNSTLGKLVSLNISVIDEFLEFEFVTQMCSRTVSDEKQPQWLPQLPVYCAENGLTVSEHLFIIVSNTA